MKKFFGVSEKIFCVRGEKKFGMKCLLGVESMDVGSECRQVVSK